MSVLDDRMAVSRYNSAGGRVTTYIRDPNSLQWEYDADVSPGNMDRGGDFGHGLALHYVTLNRQWLLACGEPLWDGISEDGGKSYVYELDGQGNWVQQAQILPEKSIEREWFGNEIAWATAGDRTFLIVGAPGSDGFQLIGSVYVFEQNGQGHWVQKQHLQAPDGSPDDAFGSALDASEINGVSLLAVGSPGYTQAFGKAYFYRFDAQSDSWIFETMLQPPNPHQDLYGLDVSIAPATDMPGCTHRAAVGRSFEGSDGNMGRRGACYLYLRADNGTWHQEARLVPPPENPQDDMEFGRRVDLESDGKALILVSATREREFGYESGCAYVVERNPNSGQWVITQQLVGHEEDVGDVTSAALALGSGLSTDLAVLGAPSTQCPGGQQYESIGSVYVFDLDTQDQNGACPPPVLTLQKTPDCSSGPGGEIEVRWFQATPDDHAHVALLFSRRAGTFVVPPGHQCAGLPLGLGSFGLQVAYTGSAGQFGAGRITALVPRGVCGGYLQLIDLTRCAASNVVRIQ